MKVLFCTNAFEKVSNGPAKFAHLLLSGAKEAGFEVQILTDDITNGTEFVHKITIALPRLFKWSSQFVRMWKYHRKAMELRKTYPFDIIVYNNALVGLISFISFKRTVGMINDYTTASSSLDAVFSGRIKLKSAVLFHYVEYFTCKLAKNIIVNSNYLKTALSKAYSCKEAKFHVLYKAIDSRLVSFDRRNVVVYKEKGSVLFVKTNFELGGLYNLIEAVKQVDGIGKLYIAGPAEIHHDKLHKILKGANINYELSGYTPPEKIYLMMEQAAIFCVPSSLEAFGVANLEAMAMGCKIVSSNVGGIPEAVGSQKFAWLVPPDDIDGLTSALENALATSEKEDVNALNEHLEQFSSTAVLLKFKEILQECL